MAERPAILITRPEGQLDALAAAVEKAGGRPVPFPLLRISEVIPERALVDHHRITEYSLAIFVSRNAVSFGARYFRDEAGRFLPGTRLLAVGAGTASELQALGATVRFPDRADSEGILQMADTQKVTGQRILIVRGVGGRETLAEGLRARGATVAYLEVYERAPYERSPAELAALLARESVGLVVITSGESLSHFDRLFTASGVAELPALLLSSGRLADEARALGYEECLVAAGAETDKLADAIAAWVASC